MNAVTIVRLSYLSVRDTLSYSDLVHTVYFDPQSGKEIDAMKVSPATALVRRCVAPHILPIQLYHATKYNLRGCDDTLRRDDLDVDAFYRICCDELRDRVQPLLVLERFYTGVCHVITRQGIEPHARARTLLLSLAGAGLPSWIDIDIGVNQPRYTAEVVG